ncbi:hypothetical protein GCM10010361_53570 [Streptomyces olivaceiscleroticus]|uniref:Uncharacterized protein n=1 Tax=Streptomyces olivaceiscleroticus TaxID=68245 RepID=A0ABN1AR37_9ACTN
MGEGRARGGGPECRGRRVPGARGAEGAGDDCGSGVLMCRCLSGTDAIPEPLYRYLPKTTVNREPLPDREPLPIRGSWSPSP